MPRYQIKAVTLIKGNPVFLPHGMEISADNEAQAGQRLADNIFELTGMQVIGIHAIIRADMEVHWEAEPEKPNLFNNGGDDPDALPRTRGRPKGSKNKPKQIEDKRTRFDRLPYDG